ncbi:uncharacterized protein LOC124271958 [Haliotis rubra]|uniref:uncharacterized protein LOC124271958 n=1 Tax=Haliotis rubra TaxID=36100 RepID=UPI001EE60D64|nr:uncharacterized protein LOC124271958 [Haliotis rubra]
MKLTLYAAVIVLAGMVKAATLNQDNADCPVDRRFLIDLKSLLKLHLGEKIIPTDSPHWNSSGSLLYHKCRFGGGEVEVEAAMRGEERVVDAGGTTFTRWGRTTCPQGNDVVYKGYAGGSHYQAKGGPGTTLCLPEAPIYEKHTSEESQSYIFGTEYQTEAANAPLHRLLQDDVPCVVCQSHNRTSAIMVPARNECFPGWHLEYKGYLFGGNTQHTASSDYVCVDGEAEAIPGGKANTNGHLLYLIDAKCGALPCPPYVDGWELTCALCTK